VIVAVIVLGPETEYVPFPYLFAYVIATGAAVVVVVVVGAAVVVVVVADGTLNNLKLYNSVNELLKYLPSL
jgi:hypothetical protein